MTYVIVRAPIVLMENLKTRRVVLNVEVPPVSIEMHVKRLEMGLGVICKS